MNNEMIKMLRSGFDVLQENTYVLCVKIVNLHLIVESFNQHDYISINKEHMKTTILIILKVQFCLIYVRFNLIKRVYFSYIHVKQVNCKSSN